MLFNRLNKLKLFYVITSIMIHRIALAIDLQPGEIKAPSGRFNAAQISYLYVEKGDKYTHGIKPSNTSNINQNAMLFRLGHAFEINQIPAYIYVQTSYNHMENKNLPSNIPNADSNGVGDTTIAFALWPYANREKDEYFGMAGYVSLPTGDYDRNRAINSGLNIFQTALQAGYQTKISNNINWMTALDAILSSNNNQYLGNNKLEKDLTEWRDRYYEALQELIEVKAELEDTLIKLNHIVMHE
jgi:hypothetical protein